ncbi:TRAP transporter substrate-binding protein [Paracoccus sediminis]|uniref:TRAP transporter substrate-binding protein n=1 Tax=Paracoccus sediminis TaxID=1214787 RepID=A0A238WPE1_9RHOB|nr:TRAP transporter substrate-binding protein [Paracoccus sediminis]TBN50483.1 TRAP transporter substrate-binding protein [Paracoccus sediminis]SNR47549.1 tripartite ATP-independent transporter solute receptor, DctP family [Paracoccus sediminis]
MTTTFNRRALLRGATALLAAPAILGFPRGAQAATTMTLGHNAAPGNPRGTAADEFARLVAENTGGEFAVRVAGAEQLGNEQSLLTSLRTGAVDMTVNSQGSCSALVPEIAALGLPFLFDTSEDAFRVLAGPVGAALADRFAAVNMVPLGWWDNGIRHITNSQKPIVVPADLAGLTIRTPPDPMTIDIFTTLGAATEQISFGELYIALQQGVVDGQENPLTNIASSKLYEVNPYISLSGHKWEVSPFLMSQIRWQQLNDDQKGQIQAAADAATTMQRGLIQDSEKTLFDQFSADPNLKINEVDKEAFRAASAPVADIWTAKPFGDFVRQLIDAAKA